VINIHRSTDSRLEMVERIAKGCWIEVTNPSPDEARQLASELKIPVDFLVHALLSSIIVGFVFWKRRWL
jgi:hypothetical protein